MIGYASSLARSFANETHASARTFAGNARRARPTAAITLTEPTLAVSGVGAAGFEPATSCSQSRRARPGCATPRVAHSTAGRGDLRLIRGSFVKESAGFVRRPTAVLK